MARYRAVLDGLLNQFVQRSREIFGDDLTGVYLHGSAAMGCFRWETGDLDLLVVVKEPLTDGKKRRYMDMVVALNEAAPPRGLEMSVLLERACRPFVYPTPFELHFSMAHLGWYRADPEDYIARMRGVDRDLAAHITVLRGRGMALAGRPIREVFAEVPAADYWDSICSDMADAETEIMKNPVYVILNLCRALAYRADGGVRSKPEGGAWGLAHTPPRYHGLISDALAAYQSDGVMEPDKALAEEYAGYMLARLRRPER